MGIVTTQHNISIYQPITLPQHHQNIKLVADILLKLITYKIPVTTIPSHTLLHHNNNYNIIKNININIKKKNNNNTPVIAGRCKGSRQLSPTLDWIFLDAKLEVYNILGLLQNKLKMKHVSTLSEVFQDSVLWSWRYFNC